MWNLNLCFRILLGCSFLWLMGVEVVGSDMAQVSVDKVTEVDKSFLHDKENGKLDKDPVHNEPIKVDSHGEEPEKGEENNASDANFPKDVDRKSVV